MNHLCKEIKPASMEMVKEYLRDNLRVEVEEYKEYYSSGVNFKLKLVLDNEVINTAYFDVSFR